MAGDAPKEQAITRVTSHFDDKAVRKTLQDQAHIGFYLPIRAPLKITDNDLEAFRDLTLQTIGNCRITYLEFGVFSGTSMRSIASRFTDPGCRFYGFDSFEGLPETWAPIPESDGFKAGQFSTGGRHPVIDDPRVSFVTGWFQNTLPGFLASGAVGHGHPHLVHFDADLYSATLFILAMLWPVLPEYYFIMDEFCYDEVVAMRDFAISFPVKIEFIAQMGADRPDKIFGHVRRVPFNL